MASLWSSCNNLKFLTWKRKKKVGRNFLRYRCSRSCRIILPPSLVETKFLVFTRGGGVIIRLRAQKCFFGENSKTFFFPNFFCKIFFFSTFFPKTLFFTTLNIFAEKTLEKQIGKKIFEKKKNWKKTIFGKYFCPCFHEGGGWIISWGGVNYLETSGIY